MCGIAGIIASGISALDREEMVGRMVRRQQHRGPDDSGRFSNGNVTLGMCRLAIFDPANGRQPMSTPDGRFHIVFNGAIYNFKELRSELVKYSWRFNTECDTEVLLAAYAQFGDACLHRLRGMFAFAVWDTKEQTLFAARCPFGIKPFYYAQLPGNTFVFSSEINGLLASHLVPREIDPVSVGDYLAWFAVPAPRTIYRRVSNLPPGYQIKVDASGRCRIGAWWRLPATAASDISESYEDFTDNLRQRLMDTVRVHQLADVPVGAFLSGGLDSTAIVGLLREAGTRQLKTFSLIFDEKEFSEQPAAQLAAKTFETEHYEETLTGKRLADELPKILRTFDQPTGDGINTYYISESASRGGVKVALSGLGGDEVFGGYPSFRDMPRMASLLPYWRQVPISCRREILRVLRRRDARSRKLADFLEYARDLNELCSLRRRVLSEEGRMRLLSPEGRRLADRQGPNHPMLDDFAFELQGADSFQTVSAWEMRTYMADVLLRDSDVFSMASSLELRVPFVDRVFVEWWWNQPRKYKFQHRRLKSALSDSVKGLVPDGLRGRAKRGFALPYAHWMRRELKPFLDEVFSSESLNHCPWLDKTAVANEWRAYQTASDPNAWLRIWTLAILVAFATQPFEGG